jgi:hypothetical protein
MTNAVIHPDRKCITCANRDEDGCVNGFPEDLVSCTAHQTETEADFFITTPDRIPLVVLFEIPAGLQ